MGGIQTWSGDYSFKNAYFISNKFVKLWAYIFALCLKRAKRLI